LRSVCCAYSCSAVSTNAWLSPPGSWQPPTNTGPGCCERKQAYQCQTFFFLENRPFADYFGKMANLKKFFLQASSLRVHGETALTSVCWGLPRPRRTQPRVGRDRRARTTTTEREQVTALSSAFLRQKHCFREIFVSESAFALWALLRHGCVLLGWGKLEQPSVGVAGQLEPAEKHGKLFKNGKNQQTNLLACWLAQHRFFGEQIRWPVFDTCLCVCARE